MNLVFQANNLDAYLEESDIIDIHAPQVQEKISQIKSQATNDVEQARLAFEYVRDGITHSFDANSDVVTIAASQVVDCKEGICFAKSHLLAAILRGLDIPTGLCYQRVTRKGTPESGYTLHGLNAVYLPSKQKWFRVDPRGNKPGVNSEFNLDSEQLAYTIHEDLGEVDYPYVYAAPAEDVLQSMKNAADCHDLFINRPEALPAFQKSWK